jgi:hypothetical protein
VRSVPATLVAFLLLLMLAVTTPTGTGSGVHDSMLLHPLFSHTHVIDGRVVSHEQLASNAHQTPIKGLAIGAGAGAAAVADGLAISPTLPWQEATELTQLTATYAPIDVMMPSGTTTQPPDPPPTLAA